jgi:hypothetical protein
MGLQFGRGREKGRGALYIGDLSCGRREVYSTGRRRARSPAGGRVAKLGAFSDLTTPAGAPDYLFSGHIDRLIPSGNSPASFSKCAPVTRQRKQRG